MDTHISVTGWHGWHADAPKPAIAPFGAEQAKKHQEEWAAYLNVPVEWKNSIGMKFRLIPPGEFLMGSTPEQIEEALKFIDPNDKHWQVCIRSEAPQHKVVLSRPVYVGVTEVTQAQYENVTGTNPSHFSADGNGKDVVANLETGNYPVESVTWNDAAEFCVKLSQQEKFRPFYLRAGEIFTPLEGMGYRLLTEAEWEFSCRAGTMTKYWNGDENDGLVQVGWYANNSGGHPQSNTELKYHPFGLFNVHGNVFEWVEDVWEPSFYSQFKTTIAVDPKVQTFPIPTRVARGGSWSDSAPRCRSSYRIAYGHLEHNQYVGFRLALSVEAVRQALKVTGPAMLKAGEQHNAPMSNFMSSNPKS